MLHNKRGFSCCFVLRYKIKAEHTFLMLITFHMNWEYSGSILGVTQEEVYMKFR